MNAIPYIPERINESQDVRFLNDADRDSWDKYVYQHEGSSIYHLAGWKKLVEEVFGHETVYLYSTGRAGKINGVLPVVRLKSTLFGNYAVSMPFFNYGGVVADSAQVEQALLERACGTMKSRGVSHIEFRHTRGRESAWPVRRDKVTMVLDLPENEETLWKALGAKLRAQIKRPRRENPEVSLGGLELLDDFYRVFAVNMRDLGTPVYSRRFFESILRTYPGAGRIITVCLRGKPVGGAFLLGFRDTLEIPWASTLKEVNRFSINMLLYWEVLAFAIGKGYRRFDFGRCTRGSGTHRFKKQWGAREKPLYWHYWLRDGAKLPGLTPDNPKFRLAVSVWRNLPLFVTNRLGPPIVKNLP